jgi:hypothetical protein
MADSGQSWQRIFKGLPEQARAVRQWTRARVEHVDAEQVANELFVAVLGGAPLEVELTLSTADTRLRITARGPAELALRHTYGPGRRIISALAALSGETPDGRGLWAQLTKE